jgi:hypothetical protein
VSGSDCELEGSAVACKFGKAVDRRPQHLGGEHASARRVVALGRADVPYVVLAHGDDPVTCRGLNEFDEITIGG